MGLTGRLEATTGATLYAARCKMITLHPGSLVNFKSQIKVDNAKKLFYWIFWVKLCAVRERAPFTIASTGDEDVWQFHNSDIGGRRRCGNASRKRAGAGAGRHLDWWHSNDKLQCRHLLWKGGKV
jgi:hypothetical protein